MKQLLAALLLTLSFQTIAADKPKVSMETTKGTIVIELYPDKAPISVENFLHYVNDGAYNGTIFHRVIKGFMNQGGGFTPDLQKKSAKYPPIKNEADNGLKNKRGTIAMARTMEPNSATNQFFFNTADNAFLDHTGRSDRGWGYTVFGKVTDGMDVVDKIATTRTGPRGPFRSDVPLETIEITSVKLIEEKVPAKPQ
ncbi:Peptidyl-prolyl cis-trans isomerase PpiB [hydrothermal vent metagenome]|uniref:peptidylprolyl isomerase n=1 Tax=hydrothermal vent metagenome TaxID=652676 RepID=A0A3B0Y062_9ZZZZ